MTVNLYPSRTIERYIDSAWEDISAYVVGKIAFDYGFLTDAYDDRLAKPGKFDLVLNNASSHFDITTDFKKNMLFRITFTWYGLSRVFICYLDYIEPPKFNIGAESVYIKVHLTDWLGVAYKHLLKSIVVDTDQKINEAATTLLTDIPLNPTNTSFDVGTQTFPIVFDAIRMGKTSLYSELNHLTLSELGNTYIANDDTLVIENYSRRNQYIPLTETPYAVDGTPGYLLACPFVWTGSTWSISGGKAVNAPTLGSELFTNPGFDSDTAWTKGTGWTIGSGQATRNTASGGASLTQAVFTAGLWHQISWDLAAYVSGNIFAQFGDTTNTGPAKTTPASYIDIKVATGTAGGIRSSGTPNNATVDNVSGKALTTSSLFYTINTAYSAVKVKATPTLTASTQAGVVVCLDSAASPANFLIAYHNGTNVRLDKCVGGTYTNLINASATYVAGAEIELITTTSGGNLLVDVNYNGAAVGTQQTVSDAGIVSNTIHGLFSTYSGNQFDSFTLLKQSDNSEIFADTFERASLNPTEYDRYLTTHDGSRLLYSVADEQTYSGVLSHFQDADIVHGKNIINDVEFTAHPRETRDGSAVVSTYNLYTLVDLPPIPIPNGSTITLRGEYYAETDTSKLKIDAVMNVATPGEQGFTASNSQFRLDPIGTTGMTLNFVGGADSWKWTIANNSGVLKNLEYWAWGGQPIDRRQAVNYAVEDTASQSIYGKQSVSVDQVYQQELTMAAAEAPALIANESAPRLQLKSVSTVANADQNELAAFMLTDIGDLRRITITNPGIDTLFFVHGIKGTIDPGGIIEYTFKVKEKIPVAFSQRSLAVQSSPANSYIAVAWSPELSQFVAVGNTSGTTTHIMTSPNGKDWTARTSPNASFYAVCWSPELSLWVAVGNFIVATSPDGITWTSRTCPNRDWRGVAWSASLGLFVACAENGTGNRIMTSPDGITWTARTSAADNNWRAIAWSPTLGLFAACAWSGSGNRIMTSPDGINWTTRTTTDRQWLGICWSEEQGKFVSIAAGYSMVSTNGTTWTESSHAGAGDYHYITYSPYLDIYMTVAGAAAAGNRRVMYSSNGTSWTILVPPEENGWTGICWSEELSIFVIVGTDGTHRVMTF